MKRKKTEKPKDFTVIVFCAPEPFEFLIFGNGPCVCTLDIEDLETLEVLQLD